MVPLTQSMHQSVFRIVVIHAWNSCVLYLTSYYTYSMFLRLQYIVYKCSGLVLYFAVHEVCKYELLMHEAQSSTSSAYYADASGALRVVLTKDTFLQTRQMQYEAGHRHEIS